MMCDYICVDDKPDVRQIRLFGLICGLLEPSLRLGLVNMILMIYSHQAFSSWTVDVHFEADVTDLTSPLAEVTGSGDSWRLTNKQFDGDLTPGTLFPLR